MYNRFRKRLFDILDFPVGGDWITRAADSFILALIVLNVVAIVLETIPEIRHASPGLFHWFEVFSVLVFSTEYILRLWTCTTDPRWAHPIWGRIRYALTPMAIVDLLAVLPFYLVMFNLMLFGRVRDLRFLRALRLLRIVRVMKLARYIRSVHIITRVVRERRNELYMTLILSAMLLVLSSSLMYYVEHDAQPDKFSSIPASMWWSAVTMTTVGYGDICPVTPLGRVIAAVVALMGIGLFALPTAILGSGFIEAMREEREEKQSKEKGPPVCPHCGKLLNGTDK